MIKTNKHFHVLGQPDSGVIFCKSLIGPRLCGYLLDSVLASDSTENGEYSGPFKTFCVGNIVSNKRWAFMDIVNSAHELISKMSYLSMGRQIQYTPNRHSFFTVKHQEVGQEHKVHSDNDPATIRGEERQAIVMSSIISLSSKYEGGLLQFPEYGISMKLEAGDCVFFPSHGHWHAVTEVTAGDRYSLMHFWE
jgi:hypothetical protein